jgi:hypothetical protein
MTLDSDFNLLDCEPPITREARYSLLLETVERLNKVIESLDPAVVSALFDNFLLCSGIEPLDVLQLGESYLTNLCGVLNAILAFRDNKGLTYRMIPIHEKVNSCFRVKRFTVLACISDSRDSIFPLVSDQSE